MRQSHKKAFTLIEIIIVMGILAMLVLMAVLNVVRNRQTAEHVLCLENRRVIEHAETQFLSYEKVHSENISELLTRGYLNSMPGCPSGGIYAWEDYPKTDHRYQASMGCSVHTEETVASEETD